ncbi:MAG: phospholipase D-like domain-containing protein [Candidatus Baltobacteraceae bacterium]
MNASSLDGRTLSDSSALLQALASARSVRFSAYLLRQGRFLDALEEAAARGADVRVTLQGAPYGGDPAERARLAQLNAGAAEALRARGARVHLTSEQEPMVHLKAAVVDGTAYLDDRNWSDRGGDTIVATSVAADVSAVASALDGVARSSEALATEKDRALSLESHLIHQARGPVDCESESFSGSSVYSALKERALAGGEVRLLVTRRDLEHGRNAFEVQALERLAQAGVEIRVGQADDKLCLASGEAWVGSANASGGRPRTLDWGLRSRDATLAGASRERFEANWRTAKPFDGLALALPESSQDLLRTTG